jgi:hypothetical protein
MARLVGSQHRSYPDLTHLQSVEGGLIVVLSEVQIF